MHATSSSKKRDIKKEKLIKLLKEKREKLYKKENNQLFIDLINSFLKRNNDINIINYGGFTLLHYAVLDGDEELVKFLLENGANPNIQSNINKNTPLHINSSIGSQKEKTINIMRLLLENGANPNIQDEKGWTPLMELVKINRIELIELILQYNVNLNIKDDKNDTAFELARFYYNNYKIMKILTNYEITKGKEFKNELQKLHDILFYLKISRELSENKIEKEIEEKGKKELNSSYENFNKLVKKLI